MPNKNYLKGRNKEYKIVKKFRERGFDIVQRTAGSRSPIDIIAIDTNSKKLRLIQCKPDTMNAHQQQKIREKNKELNGWFEVGFSVV